jgi:hypothetical protein
VYSFALSSNNIDTCVCFEENRMNFNLKAAGALFSRAKQVFENKEKKLIRNK